MYIFKRIDNTYGVGDNFISKENIKIKRAGEVPVELDKIVGQREEQFIKK